jgi:lipopolysaccharide/colanic/teichoic acid biosynthesis glycosyltransferase
VSADAVSSSTGLLPEPLFFRALSHERKRAERSGRGFVLMLVDPGQPFSDDGSDGLYGRTVDAILSSIRDTDICGWYRANGVLGVIFTELGAADTRTALSVLRTRVTAALTARLRPQWLARVDIAFHCFPDGDAASVPLPLYPDVVERDKTLRLSRLVKRGIDVAGSALALICLAPLLLAIAAAVRLSSPGPILYRQQRIGQYGVPFTLFKFRSMYATCDSRPHEEYVKRFIAGSADPTATGENGHAVFKLTEDPRITRVGRILRRTSLDELPQFINVLRGDMSLVGPRPPIAYELAQYGAWHRRRLVEVRPGITGLWQVNGRSRVGFNDMVRLDLKYARHCSTWLDLKILLRTPRAVFFGDGAY